MAVRKSSKKLKTKSKNKSKTKPKLKQKPKQKVKSKAKSKTKTAASSKKNLVSKKSVTKKISASEPIGVVIHFFTKLGVAIVKFNTKVSLGAKLHFRGATTDFKEVIKSMQYNHQPIKEAKKGQEVGIKVNEKVREGDEVFLVE